MTTTAPTSRLPGLNICLMGPSGSGKTHSIGTLVDAGFEVFYLGLEPGLESLIGYFTDDKQFGGRGLPYEQLPANLHWHQLEAPVSSAKEMMATAEKVLQLSLDSLAKLQDPSRSKHNQFIKLLETLNNFVDQRTGQSYGACDEWPPHYALVVDGLTGLCRSAMSMVVGGKPVRSQADWQIAQDQVERLLRMLCDHWKCSFILLAHVEKEVDQVLGGQKLMVSALGKALAPKIPAMFSDVVLTKRDGTTWSWDTASPLADTKTRNLPVAANLRPEFGQIIKRWTARGGVIPPTATEELTTTTPKS